MTFDELEGIAIGVMRLDPNVFYSLEYMVFMEALYQYNKSFERQVRLAWETTRFETAQLLRPNLKTPNSNLKEIVPLPWDDEAAKIRKALDSEAVREAANVLEFLRNANKH